MRLIQQPDGTTSAVLATNYNPYADSSLDPGMVHPINNYIHVTGDLELGDTIAELNRRRAIYLKSRSLTVQFTAVIYLLFSVAAVFSIGVVNASTNPIIFYYIANCFFAIFGWVGARRFNRKLLRVYVVSLVLNFVLFITLNAMDISQLKQIWVIITLFGIIQLLNIMYVVNFYRVLPFRQIDRSVVDRFLVRG